MPVRLGLCQSQCNHQRSYDSESVFFVVSSGTEYPKLNEISKKVSRLWWSVIGLVMMVVMMMVVVLEVTIGGTDE